MDFIVALPRVLSGRDAVMVLLYRCSNMVYFIAYHKSYDATYIVDLFS